MSNRSSMKNAARERPLFLIQVAPQDVPPILGLRYLPQYITDDEELALAAAIDPASWDISWDRRRQPYGVAYGGKNETSPPIPDWGVALAQRMQREMISNRTFDQMLVNEYLPGQGIVLHADYRPFDRTVVSLSLLAPCVMDFRRPSDGRKEHLLLEPRSILILSDTARYEWQHGIAKRKSDRWRGLRLCRERRLSVTLRLRKSALR